MSAHLAKGEIFLKLDLWVVYYHIRIKEVDEWKTAFDCPLGCFQFRVLPFGLQEAPAVFVQLTHEVLHEHLYKGVPIYLDDLLIYTETTAEHVKMVRAVPKKLPVAQLYRTLSPGPSPDWVPGRPPVLHRSWKNCISELCDEPAKKKRVQPSDGAQKLAMGLLKIILPLLIGLGAYYFYPQETFSSEMVQGMRVLLTGSSSGIGEQMAYEFARMGAHLMLTARREAQLQKVVQKCRELGAGSAHYVVADMSNLTAARTVVEETEAKLGGLDQLVLNHVGGTSFGPFKGTVEPVITSMNLNFFSYVQLTVSAMDLLLESKGNIVAISSMSGRVPSPFTVSYSAAKFALEGFFTSLRAELRLRNMELPITVAVLGYIDTETAVNSVGNKINHSPSPKEDCAREIVKGGVLRYREVFYPYWTVKFIQVCNDLMPNLIDQVIGYGYKLENIL